MSANKVKEIAGAPRFIEKYKSFFYLRVFRSWWRRYHDYNVNPDGSVTERARWP